MRALPGALCVVLALLAAACAAPMRLSKDFVVLDGYEYGADFRAVTADDARVWFRRFEDPNEADLAFWVQALERDFVDQRGYDLVDRGEVTDARGRPGRWFHCTANVRGERIGYLIALWAAGDEVTVVEFAARAEVFAARLEAVMAALRTVGA